MQLTYTVPNKSFTWVVSYFHRSLKCDATTTTISILTLMINCSNQYPTWPTQTVDLGIITWLKLLCTKVCPMIIVSNLKSRFLEVYIKSAVEYSCPVVHNLVAVIAMFFENCRCKKFRYFIKTVSRLRDTYAYLSILEPLFAVSLTKWRHKW